MRRHLDAVLKGIDFNDLHENNIFEMTRNDLAKPLGGWVDGWLNGWQTVDSGRFSSLFD